MRGLLLHPGTEPRQKVVDSTNVCLVVLVAVWGQVHTTAVLGAAGKRWRQASCKLRWSASLLYPCSDLAMEVIRVGEPTASDRQAMDRLCPHARLATSTQAATSQVIEPLRGQTHLEHLVRDRPFLLLHGGLHIIKLMPRGDGHGSGRPTVDPHPAACNGGTQGSMQGGTSASLAANQVCTGVWQAMGWILENKGSGRVVYQELVHS